MSNNIIRMECRSGVLITLWHTLLYHIHKSTKDTMLTSKYMNCYSRFTHSICSLLENVIDKVYEDVG